MLFSSYCAFSHEGGGVSLLFLWFIGVLTRKNDVARLNEIGGGVVNAREGFRAVREVLFILAFGQNKVGIWDPVWGPGSNRRRVTIGR